MYGLHIKITNSELRTIETVLAISSFACEKVMLLKLKCKLPKTLDENSIHLNNINQII